MNETNQPNAGGLWARLFGVQDENEPEQSAAQTAAPVAEASPPVVDDSADTVALPAEPSDGVAEPPVEPEVAPELTTEIVEPIAEAPALAEPELAEAPAPPQSCQACGAVRKPSLPYCDDCGWMFPVGAAAATAAVAADSPLRDGAMPANAATRLQDRYELGELLSERRGVRRQRGTDSTNGHPVIVVSSPTQEAAAAAPIAEAVPVAAVADEDIMPGFDDDIPVALAVPAGPDTEPWPSVGWEKALLEKANSPALPKVLDQFSANNTDYLILEWPLGESLYDAWDNPDMSAGVRYGWLQQIAGGLQALHAAGAVLEGIRPDIVVIAEGGQARITDVTDALPLPVPADAPIKATLYTAPELILTPSQADARADLYSFGAMIYSLEYLHHPLEEKDFERQFVPLQITERFPDVHPLILRIINKTFCRDVNGRFPSDEMTKVDPTGFAELIRTLGVCCRAFEQVRLDVAAWTTTGMIRTGNEDAFTVLHGVDSRQDELNEYVMALLCDGMGGYEAGEVAAALTINEMRKYLLQQPIFAALTGGQPPQEPVDPKKIQDVLRDALKYANKEVFTASRTPGRGKRGMGCTAECVYIDSHWVIAGHIGDSRVYHLHRGRLKQLTRDQTLVNRLVELGQLTEAEAEDHPRKNELQQAIGGQPDVVPGVAYGRLMRGDWVLVCSDGLTNHIKDRELETMLGREAANSAEEAARRLLNLVNLRGATDNATIVVVRAS